MSVLITLNSTSKVKHAIVRWFWYSDEGFDPVFPETREELCSLLLRRERKVILMVVDGASISTLKPEEVSLLAEQARCPLFFVFATDVQADALPSLAYGESWRFNPALFHRIGKIFRPISWHTKLFNRLPRHLQRFIAQTASRWDTNKQREMEGKDTDLPRIISLRVAAYVYRAD